MAHFHVSSESLLAWPLPFSHHFRCLFVQTAIPIGWVDKGMRDELSGLGRGG